MKTQDYLFCWVGAIVVAVLAMSLVMNATNRQGAAVAGGALTFAACMIALKINGWL
ncbi:MAG: hypothetical protein P4L53_23385 [Candidatus Obscuribacterales bacterium]|nr:hypothetical protein [Candidatus Obscuribacterales bacterium]